ncbi:hypothetical protein QAD02_010429 [Eretmocerus hayati]|uniref:Uncharacterized protein n=1 Tax=Eretmocerus hayati TaxID=131215 RepID=A0ACC2NUV8_9HYME|nr:hypothetical protein QAD02_010429 [Eretmocerus hayati]
MECPELRCSLPIRKLILASSSTKSSRIRGLGVVRPKDKVSSRWRKNDDVNIQESSVEPALSEIAIDKRSDNELESTNSCTKQDNSCTGKLHHKDRVHLDTLHYTEILQSSDCEKQINSVDQFHEHHLRVHYILNCSIKDYKICQQAIVDHVCQNPVGTGWRHSYSHRDPTPPHIKRVMTFTPIPPLGDIEIGNGGLASPAADSCIQSHHFTGSPKMKRAGNGINDEDLAPPQCKRKRRGYHQEVPKSKEITELKEFKIPSIEKYKKSLEKLVKARNIKKTRVQKKKKLSFMESLLFIKKLRLSDRNTSGDLPCLYMDNTDPFQSIQKETYDKKKEENCNKTHQKNEKIIEMEQCKTSSRDESKKLIGEHVQFGNSKSIMKQTKRQQSSQESSCIDKCSDACRHLKSPPQIPSLIDTSSSKWIRTCLPKLKACSSKGYKAEVNIVLFEYLHDKPTTILQRAADDHKVKLTYEYRCDGREQVCILCFNTVTRVMAVGKSRREALHAAAEIALWELQESYCTIKVSKLRRHGMKIISEDDLKISSVNLRNAQVTQHDIDSEIISLIGWFSSKGLGKGATATEPISLTYPSLMFERGDEELKTNFQQSDFLKKILFILEDFVRRMPLDNLVFYNFSSEKLDLIDYFASKMGLATKRSQLHRKKCIIVMIGRPEEKLNVLRKHGGYLESYELIEPTAYNSK